MRTSKELILASKAFTKENRFKSWFETLLTAVLLFVALFITYLNIPVLVKLPVSILAALLLVRLFIIYHDYQHHTILQHSKIADLMMKAFGVFMLAPQNIWKRSHDHHHHHNSKLTLSGIGSYPTISTQRYFKLTAAEKSLYLINRHPITIMWGHFTLFIYWLNLKSLIQSPKKHLDSLAALIFHAASAVAIIYYAGFQTFVFAWWIPYTIAFGIGAYLFYCQHNFPSAKFKENHDWKYENAALQSTSFMDMSPIMHWFTGNIGYHHVHHLNARIPFYRLPEAMAKMPELQNPPKTSWNPLEVMRCFNLKLWDPKLDKMVTMKEAKANEVNAEKMKLAV